jgi:hypothetical protein
MRTAMNRHCTLITLPNYRLWGALSSDTMRGRSGSSAATCCEAALGLPGSVATSVRPRVPATGRLSSPSLPTVGLFSAAESNACTTPDASLSRTGRTASGVTSRGPKPLPPAVSTTCIRARRELHRERHTVRVKGMRRPDVRTSAASSSHHWRTCGTIAPSHTYQTQHGSTTATGEVRTAAAICSASSGTSLDPTTCNHHSRTSITLTPSPYCHNMSGL